MIPTLPVVEKKRTMGDTTDQVITPVRKVDARFSHAGDYTTNKIYCGNLLWQFTVAIKSDPSGSEQGWNVIVIWECAFKTAADRDETFAQLATWLREIQHGT